MTEKAIEANRRNAQKSSGPRTAKGKEIVKWNAVKHGLLAKEIVIKKGTYTEKLLGKVLRHQKGDYY